jgi:hypothetical protein
MDEKVINHYQKFNRLSDEDKTDLLLTCGEYVASQYTDEHRLDIYLLGMEYVEVAYSRYKDKVDYILMLTYRDLDTNCEFISIGDLWK